MTRYVAFLRAINVGSHVVKMDKLRAVFEESGFSNVATFINSGNVLFDSSSKNTSALEAKIAKALGKALGYDVAVFIRTPDELIEVCAQCETATEGSVFVGFLPAPFDAREKKIVASLVTPVDDLSVHKREIYWRARKHFRDAIFQPAKLEKALGKQATFRNVNTVRRIVALLATPLLMLVLMGAQDIPTWPFTYRDELVGNWVDAVLQHVPGQEDDAIDILRAWNRDDLRDAWGSVNIMVSLLENPDRPRLSVPQSGWRMPVGISAGDVRLMAAKARELLQHPGRDLFLKRAALLHGDAAMIVGPAKVREPFTVSFLLPRRVFAMTGDGRQEGVRGGDVNWEFGRTLLDGVANVRQDRDVESWYVGTMAYLLDVEHFDNPHFDHAERLFPRSAEIRYLAGCLHEALAGPRVQSVLEELRVPRRTALDVRSERPELNDADERFRAALESAPQHHEARLRHGRVLGRLGRHEEAVSELRTALGSLGEPLLRYYAAMFLGADEEALGRLEAAREMYEQAAALFPRAQAPQLALSQLEHRRGDRMRARTVLAPALRERDRQLDDPWWKYYVSCGRNAEAHVQATYRSIHGQPQ